MSAQEFHGLLVIDKPQGITSRAALDRVQRWFPRGTRIGHTGTLDPLATGVLVVCVGAATRLAEYVQDMAKSYRAEITLGARSDTDDADGKLTTVDSPRVPELSEITLALDNFVGEIAQVPPRFSAAKVSGRRAYDLARRGAEVTLSSRRVNIYSIEVISYQYPRLEIDVHCGKGTYIRSMARDLGEKLGCGGLIASLRRTKVGPFEVRTAIGLEVDAGEARSRLLPLAAAVSELPKLIVGPRNILDLLQGRTVELINLEAAPIDDNRNCVAVGEGGDLIAVGVYDSTQCRFTPAKVLAGQQSR